MDPDLKENPVLIFLLLDQTEAALWEGYCLQRVQAAVSLQMFILLMFKA